MRALVLASLLASFSAFATNDLQFIAAPSTSVPGPHGAAAADFNRDGILDLAVKSVGSKRNVSIFLGNGDGTFRRFFDVLEKGDMTGLLAAADMNNDGIMDVVVGRSSAIDVILGKGDGTMKDPVSTPLASWLFTLSDLDADGKLDVVYSRSFDGGMGAMLGKGDGTFGTPVKIDAGTYTTNAIAGDWDGDGKPELAAADENAKKIIFARPDGTTIRTIDVGSPVKQLAGADLNGDGFLDLVVAGDSIFVYLNDGKGTFTRREVAAVKNAQLVTVDVDGDGDVDLVESAAEKDTIWTSTWLNDGKANFHRIGRAFTRFSIAAAFGDFDGDGRLDFVGTDFEGQQLAFHRGRGDGWFDVAQFFGVNAGSGPGYDEHFPIALDFDADGKLDLLVVNETSADMTFYRGNGDGTFAAPMTITTADHHFPMLIDVDGDGLCDMTTGDGLTLHVSLNRGALKFADPVDVTVSASVFWLGRDFTGDGVPDLLTQNGTMFTFRRGLGNLKFGEPSSFPTGLGATNLLTVVFRDFDGDGKLDLLAGGSQDNLRNLSFIRNRGDGTFDAPRVSVTKNPVESIVPLDINGDGKLDLVTISFNTRPWSIHLGNGDGTFVETEQTAAASIYQFIAGDWNNDGLDDLAGVPNSGYQILFYLGRRDGTFSAPVVYDAGENPYNLTRGDFNGDGRLDVVVGNNLAGYDAVALLLNATRPPRARPARH